MARKPVTTADDFTEAAGSIERYRGWFGGVRYFWDSLTTWWSLRRGIRKASPKQTHSRLQWMSQHLYHAYRSAEEQRTRNRIQTGMKELERVADSFGIELKYTTDDLDRS